MLHYANWQNFRVFFVLFLTGKLLWKCKHRTNIQKKGKKKAENRCVLSAALITRSSFTCLVLAYSPLELVLICSLGAGWASEKIKEERQPWNQQWNSRLSTKLALCSPQVIGCLIPADLFVSLWTVSFKKKKINIAFN